MTQAKVQRLHAPIYSETLYPPLPPRIRLAANCWERVWWLTLAEAVARPPELSAIAERYNTDQVTVRAQMRTCRRLCFAITTKFSDEQAEFELAMMLMNQVQREIGEIDRVEDRPANMWPVSKFS